MGRLIQSENLASPEARSALTDAISITQNGSFNFIGGKGVMEGDPDGDTSVTPAWRSTVAHWTGGGSPVIGQSAEEWRDLREFISQQVDPIRAITPNSGAYIN